MAQVTSETLKYIREYADKGEHFPLTINEMEQLAFLAAKGMSLMNDPNQMNLFSVDNPPVNIHFAYERTFQAISSAVTVTPPLEPHGHPTLSISVSAFVKAFNEHSTTGAKDEHPQTPS